MLGNNPTSNNAVRLGAAILLGTAIAYLIWSTSSSSSSSSSSKTEKKEVKKTTKTIVSEKKTEVKKATTEATVEPVVATEPAVERTIGKQAYYFSDSCLFLLVPTCIV